MKQVSQLLHGLKTYWRGVSWLKSHPVYFLLLVVPTVLGIASAILIFNWIFLYDETIYNYVLFEPGDSFIWVFLYKVSKFFVSLALMGISLLAGFLLSNIAAVPIYDYVSVAIEKDVMGTAPQISLWQSVKLIPEELKKVTVILLVSLATMVLPVVNILGIFVTAFLIGWDFYDYPLARRGWSLSAATSL